LNLINICTIRPLKHADQISEILTQYWSQLGIKVKALYESRDFQVDSRAYLIEESWKVSLEDSDIALIQHGALSESSIPTSFLREGLAVVLILEADSLFNTEDELLLNTLKERMNGKPVLICLVNAQKYVIEEFTGLLSPHTFLRRLGYKLSNFGLTSKT